MNHAHHRLQGVGVVLRVYPPWRLLGLSRLGLIERAPPETGRFFSDLCGPSSAAASPITVRATLRTAKSKISGRA